jgi:hypothetical protein
LCRNQYAALAYGLLASTAFNQVCGSAPDSMGFIRQQLGMTSMSMEQAKKDFATMVHLKMLSAEVITIFENRLVALANVMSTIHQKAQEIQATGSQVEEHEDRMALVPSNIGQQSGLFSQMQKMFQEGFLQPVTTESAVSESYQPRAVTGFHQFNKLGIQKVCHMFSHFIFTCRTYNF